MVQQKTERPVQFDSRGNAVSERFLAALKTVAARELETRQQRVLSELNALDTDTPE